MNKDNHLITYQSCGFSSQVDYILLQCNKFLLIKDIKIIPGEECITQHHLLICDLKLKISKNTEKNININRLYLLPKLFSEMYFLFYAWAFDDVMKFENVEF